MLWLATLLQAVCLQGTGWQRDVAHNALRSVPGRRFTSSSSDQPAVGISGRAARPLRRRMRKCARIPALVDQQVHEFSFSDQQQAPQRYSTDLYEVQYAHISYRGYSSSLCR